MKPDKLILDEQDKPEVVAQIPVKTEKLIHSIRPHKGHTLFEINPVTGKCVPAVFESIDTTFPLNKAAAKIKIGVRKKVIAKPDCLYISALNKKNALIKFFNMVGKRMDK